MHEQPERAPSSGLDAAARIAATTVAMTVAALFGCAILAGLAIATTNPGALLTGAILAVVAAGCIANVLAKVLRP
jgi:amino acid transporter